jgi:hypothetical protein
LIFCDNKVINTPIMRLMLAGFCTNTLLISTERLRNLTQYDLFVVNNQCVSPSTGLAFPLMRKRPSGARVAGLMNPRAVLAAEQSRQTADIHGYLGRY